MKLPKSLLNAILVGVTLGAIGGCADPDEEASTTVQSAEPDPQIGPTPEVDQDPPLDPWDGDACPGCGRG